MRLCKSGLSTVRPLTLILVNWLIPLVLGAVTVYGFAPVSWFPLPIVALALHWYLARNQTPLRAFAVGYMFGLGWFLAGVSWVYISLHDMGMLPMTLAGVSTLSFACVLAFFPALTLALSRRRGLSDPIRWLVLAPALWALMEWTRGWLFTGFPWQALGYSQAPASPLAGYAPILGVFGVSWLAALTAGAFVARSKAGLALVTVIWLTGYGLGQVAWTQPVGEPVSVSLLQGNVAQEIKFEPEKLNETLDMYRKMTLESRSRLIILPETALPTFLHYLPKWYLDEYAKHARSLNGDVLTGVAEEESDGTYYNSMVSLGTAPTQRFRKHHLVPFGEFVPMGFHWLVEMMYMPMGEFNRGGTAQAPMAVAGQRVAMNICYEDVFGEELIHALPEATLMANVSNDAWFGDSFAPWQHLQIAQMRALETGRWWLKDNNTGITAILDEKGRVVDHLPPFTRATLHGQAQGMSGLTPFARWGNGAFLTLAGISLLVSFWLSRRLNR